MNKQKLPITLIYRRDSKIELLNFAYYLWPFAYFLGYLLRLNRLGNPAFFYRYFGGNPNNEVMCSSGQHVAASKWRWPNADWIDSLNPFFVGRSLVGIFQNMIPEYASLDIQLFIHIFIAILLYSPLYIFKFWKMMWSVEAAATLHYSTLMPQKP